MTLKISHIFGPVFQGEGPFAGRNCLFVRLFNCNLECTWCDTAYTWAVTPQKAAKTDSGILYDKNEPVYGLKNLNMREVIAELEMLWPMRKGAHPTIVVFSGGEPMMQQPELYPLMQQLQIWGHQVHIETAGTIMPTEELASIVDQWVVSPKLTNSGNRHSKRYKPDVLVRLRDLNATFKFVVNGASPEVNLAEIDSMVQHIGIRPRNVFLMPEGTDTESIMHNARRIENHALGHGYGLSLRQHVLMHGNDKDK